MRLLESEFLVGYATYCRPDGAKRFTPPEARKS
jgi:hypothetical protein